MNLLTSVAERGSVENLRVSEETMNSFKVSWQPAPGDVTRYRLTYEHIGDESSRQETSTFSTETSTVLQELQPQSTYRITVTPEYQTGPGVPLHTDGTTKEGWHGFISSCCYQWENTSCQLDYKVFWQKQTSFLFFLHHIKIQYLSQKFFLDALHKCYGWATEANISVFGIMTEY